MGDKFRNLREYCKKGPDAIERATSHLLDAKTELPDSTKCPLLSDLLADFQERGAWGTADDLQNKIKLLERLEIRLDRQKFGKTYIYIIRAFKRIAEEERISPDENRDAQYKQWIWAKWINLCLSTNESPSIRSFFQDIDIDPENELFQIAKKKDATIIAEKNKRTSLQVLLHWFLRRYDLPAAAKIVLLMPNKAGLFKQFYGLIIRRSAPKKLATEETETNTETTSAKAPPKSKAALWWNLGTWALFFALVPALAIQFDKLNLRTEIVDPVVELITNFRYFDDPDLFTTLLSWIYVVAILLTGKLTWDIFRRSGKLLDWLKLAIPRMVGGIVVGYLPILFSDETWRTIYNLSELQGALLFVSSILFAGIYLLMEVNNSLQNSAKAAMRAAQVLGLGLLESFVIGLVISDLVTNAFLHLSGLPITSAELAPGLWGRVYPKLLTLYFPLSVVIGIFIQIIWEDKPVTQPI